MTTFSWRPNMHRNEKPDDQRAEEGVCQSSPTPTSLPRQCHQYGFLSASATTRESIKQRTRRQLPAAYTAATKTWGGGNFVNNLLRKSQRKTRPTTNWVQVLGLTDRRGKLEGKHSEMGRDWKHCQFIPLQTRENICSQKGVAPLTTQVP